MKDTVIIAASEYSELAGYNHAAGYVRQMIKAGRKLDGVVSYRKTANCWLVEVSGEWFNANKK